MTNEDRFIYAEAVDVVNYFKYAAKRAETAKEKLLKIPAYKNSPELLLELSKILK